MPIPSNPATSAGPAFACPEWAKLPSPAGPVPVPFPNAAASAPNLSSAAKVNLLQTQGLSKAGAQDAVAGKPVTGTVDKAVLRGSAIPASSGDEAGTNGGVVSGAAMKPAMGSSKVVFPAANNAQAGRPIAPSQAKILVAR